MAVPLVATAHCLVGDTGQGAHAAGQRTAGWRWARPGGAAIGGAAVADVAADVDAAAMDDHIHQAPGTAAPIGFTCASSAHRRC